MKNKYGIKDHTLENIILLIDNGYNKLDSAIFDPKSKTSLLIDKTNKTFWIGDEEAVKDFWKIIKEKFSQKVKVK